MIIIHSNTKVNTIRLYARLARPKHWLKNVLIFVPLLYAQRLFDSPLLISTLITFVAFCAVSSAVYTLNDIIDAEKDRRHPIKCTRPIAAGQITKPQAMVFVLALCIGVLALIIVFTGMSTVLIFAGLYIALNIAYSLKLKNYAIVDCFCIAAGFILRLLAGGGAIGVALSEWLLLTMIAASLFMAFGKRRGEMVHVDKASNTRKVLESYNLGILNGMMFTCAGMAIVFYTLWTMNSVAMMIYTVPLVLFIVFKYLLIIHSETSQGDPTTVILGDKVLIVAAGILGLTSAVLLYL